MKRINLKKWLVILGLVMVALLCVADCKAQSYSVGNYYAYRGETTKNCGSSYPKYYYDNWGYQQFAGYYRTCRTLTWKQEQYSGYVYLWNNYGWYTEWRSGYYWYCYWVDYEERVY